MERPQRSRLVASPAPEGGDAGTDGEITAERNFRWEPNALRWSNSSSTARDVTLGVTQGEEIQYALSPRRPHAARRIGHGADLGWDEPAEATHKYGRRCSPTRRANPSSSRRNSRWMRNSDPDLHFRRPRTPRRPHQLAVQTISTTDGVEDSPYVFLESRTTATQTATPGALVSMRSTG